MSKVNKFRTYYTPRDVLTFISKEINRSPWLYLWNPTKKMEERHLSHTRESLFILNDPWNPIPSKLLALAPEAWDRAFQAEIEKRIYEIVEIAVSRMNRNYYPAYSITKGEWELKNGEICGDLIFEISRYGGDLPEIGIRVSLITPSQSCASRLFTSKYITDPMYQGLFREKRMSDPIIPPEAGPFVLRGEISSRSVILNDIIKPNTPISPEDTKKEDAELEEDFVDDWNILDKLKEFLQARVNNVTSESPNTDPMDYLRQVYDEYYAMERPSFAYSDYMLTLLGDVWESYTADFFKQNNLEDPRITVRWIRGIGSDGTYSHLFMEVYIEYKGRILRGLINYKPIIEHGTSVEVDLEDLTLQKTWVIKEHIMMARLKSSLIKGMIAKGLHKPIYTLPEGINEAIQKIATEAWKDADFGATDNDGYSSNLLVCLSTTVNDMPAKEYAVRVDYPLSFPINMISLSLAADLKAGLFNLRKQYDSEDEQEEESSEKSDKKDDERTKRIVEEKLKTMHLRYVEKIEEPIQETTEDDGDHLVNFIHRLLAYLRVEGLEKYPWFLPDFYYHPTDVGQAKLREWGTVPFSSESSRDHWKVVAADTIGIILSREEPTTEAEREIMGLIASIWKDTMIEYARLVGEKLEVFWDWNPAEPATFQFTLQQNGRIAMLSIDISKVNPTFKGKLIQLEEISLNETL